MNKKVSTLLTCGLMLGGSLLSSSAFAEVLPIGEKVSADNKFVNGGTYFIVQDEGAAATDASTQYGALGMKWSDVNQTAVEHIVGMLGNDQSLNYGNEPMSLDNYLWTVTSSTIQGKGTVYTFVNRATGETLRIANNGGAYDGFQTAKGGSTDATAPDATQFAFGAAFNDYTNGQVNNGWYLLVSATLMDNTDANDKAVVVSGGRAQVVTRNDATNGGVVVNLYSVADEVIDTPDADTLNKLYNRAGFNFELAEGVENIFGNEPVKAIHVASPVEDNSKTDGYYAFPEGTYFATSTPTGSFPSSNRNNAQLEYLKGCTFIAVSPTNNIDGNATCQADGRGFTLMEVSANDLNLYAQTAPGLINSDLQTRGSQVSVFNACFTGWENPANPGKFALALNRIYYQATDDANAVHATNNVALDVISHHHDITNSLVTDSDWDINYVFTLGELAAIDPTDILVEDGASIFNIQFISGDANDHESEYGKYLTVATDYTNDNRKTYWANGSALADLNTPAYQFVVSNVSGTDITFTNRETGKSFTTKLFEYGDGESEYSVALSSSDSDVNISDVEDNGDVEYVTELDMNESYIRLIRVENVNKFDGFKNVADETILTMALARDFTPTSNKLYPIVELDENTHEYVFPTGNDVKFTDEVSEAVQWQLVKATKEPTYQTYNYYYINNGRAVVRNWGDTVAVQAYNLQLVRDGQAIADKYLHATGTSDADDVDLTDANSATNFYIKENVDGSVSLKTSIDGTIHVSTSYFDNVDEFDATQNMEMRSVAYPTSNDVVEATDVKVYLFNDSPLQSWQNQGHVTLQSEMGNYITMSEDNAGLVNSVEPETFYLTKTDESKAIPSFYISKGINGDAESERLYLFNPVDSVPYLVNAPVDAKYEWDEVTAKAIFKAGTLVSPDTMNTIIKGVETLVAQNADNQGVEGGLNRFKFQIVETEDEDGFYYIRQINSPYIDEENGKLVSGNNTLYLRNLNGKLTWTRKLNAERVKVAIEEVAAPTANESVSASEVKVIAVDGAINIKNAAGKNVVVSTILGQIVANEVLTSDNATISVPAGIAIVSVDGEEAVKVSVR